jgi:hypothetical protein
MTRKIDWLLVWMAASVVALIVALLPVYAALVDGHYIPVGNDSFYHARRILDILADPTSLHEFDTHIHVPEGSLLIWPWGYDYLMSMLVRLGLTLRLSADPMAILDHLPVLVFPLTLALVLSVCRQLGLSVVATLLALLATALFPLNQGLYSVGNIDHHFAEHLLVLAALASGMGWLRKPDSAARAALAAAVLGVAHCIHNGLFILQLPIVLAFILMWLRGTERPRTTWIFATALVLATLAAALPSTSLRLGRFEFFTLSWFHVYFAACVAVGCVILQRTTFSKRSLIIVVATGLLMAAPVVSQILLAERFLSVSVEGAKEIAETQSLWGLAHGVGGFTELFGLYTLLVLALPVAGLVGVWQLWRKQEGHRVLFWATTIFGLALLANMVRMHVYGSFALYLPWILLADEYVCRKNLDVRAVGLGLGLVLLLAFIPGLKTTFAARKTQSNDPYYALTHELYARLSQECAARPGIALSSLDDGNYIRYHTDCSIIANNFLLTPQHEAKAREVQALLALPAAELSRRAPDVRYLLVRRNTLFRAKPAGGIEFVADGDPESDPPLVNELLATPPEHLPPGFRLLQELAFEKPHHAPFARLFAVEQ